MPHSDETRYSFVDRERKKTLTGIGPESMIPASKSSDPPNNVMQIRWKGVVANVPAGIVVAILSALGVKYLTPETSSEKMLDEISELREELKKVRKKITDLEDTCDSNHQELSGKIKIAAKNTNMNFALIKDAIRPLGAKVEWDGMPPVTHEYLPKPLDGSTAPPIQPRGALVSVPEQ